MREAFANYDHAQCFAARVANGVSLSAFSITDEVARLDRKTLLADLRGCRANQNEYRFVFVLVQVIFGRLATGFDLDDVKADAG